MRVGSRGFSKRAEANEHLRQVLRDMVDRGGRTEAHLHVATIRGLAVVARHEPHIGAVTLAIRGVPGSETTIPETDLARAMLVTRLQNCLEGLSNLRDGDVLQLARVKGELAKANAERDAPFKHAGQLVDAREYFQQLDHQLQASVAHPPPSTPVNAPEQQEEQGRALATRWNELVSAEQQKVRDQAVSLDHRLAARAVAVRERLSHHEKSMPTKPSTLAMLTGGRAAYETTLEAWTAEHQRLQRAARTLATRRASVSPYASEPIPGCPSKAVQLAVARLKARHPDFASHLAEHAAARHAQARERARAQPEREHSRPSPDRGR